jgi:teichuronic acid biosynthesis glycosyltransferase TuaH
VSHAVTDDDVVVITASNSWADRRMADHQLAAALAVHTRVLYVDPSGVRVPCTTDESARPEAVTVLQPTRLPLVRFSATVFLSRFLIAWQIRRALRRMNPRRVVLLEGNVLFSVSRLIRAQRTVYWAQDDWRGLASLMGLNPGSFASGERRVLEAADAVVAANPEVAQRLRDAHTGVHLIPFGASTELFSGAHGAEPSDSDHPVVLMGTLNSRIDYDILDEIVSAGLPLVLAGPVANEEARGRLADLQSRGAEYAGEVDFECLPAVLSRCSVGIVPYNRSRFNLGSFPLKTIEYLAAGLPVVATDLPAVRWLRSGEVHIADDPAAFAKATRDLWERGLPTAVERARRAEFADGHDWRERALEFLQILQDFGIQQRAGVGQ